MNNYNGFYNNYYGNQIPAQTSNKLYVTSVEDALNRYASLNSNLVYFLQDESQIIEISTDIYGKKFVRVRKVVDIEPAKQKTETQANDYVTKSEFEELKNKIESLKKGVKKNDAE